MKKLYSFAALSFAVVSMNAQMTYGPTDMLNPSIPEMALSEATWEDLSMQEGPNMAWDLSQIEILGLSGSFAVADPATADGASNFPGANYAAVLDLGGDIESSIFLSVDGNEAAELGTFTSTMGFENIQNWTDTKKYFEMPVTFGDSGNDTFAGTITITGAADQDVNGILSYEVVGFGSLALPNGIMFDDALMVKTEETLESIVEAGGMTFNITTVTDTYQFLVPDAPFTVARFDHSTTTSIGGVEESFDATVVTNLTLSTPEITANEVMIYPNPATDMLTVDLGSASQAQIEVYSITGEVVASINTQRNKEQINVSAFEAGVYFVRIESNAGLKTHKVIIR